MRYAWLVILVVVVIVALALIRPATEWMWFASLGYGSVFAKILLARIELVAIFAGGFLLIVGFNLRLANRIAPPPVLSYDEEQSLRERFGAAAHVGVAALFLLGLIVLTFFVGADAWSRWDAFIRFTDAAPFGARDPLLHRDIGFYVFRLPFLKYIYGWLTFTLFVSLAGVAAFHYTNRAIEFLANVPRFAPGVKAHLSVLLSLMLLLKAWGYRLTAYELVLKPNKLFTGAGYADVHARLPALFVLTVAAVIAALAVLVGIRRLGIKWAVGALAGLIAMSLLVGSIYPALVQQISVKANEPSKERKFISWAIKATNEAYGLSKMERRTFPAESTLTASDLANNEPTIQNVRLWDYVPVQHVYMQLQEIQQYYSFPDVDIDRYWINGRYRQVMLSGREMSQDSLPENAQTWVNRHLQYTHGYGLCMSPVNVVTGEGLPEFFIRDIPPETIPGLKIERPEIYFGQIANSYVMVKTTEQEFDYPSGDENKFTTYKADSGIPMGNYLSRLLWAVRLGDPYILLNRNVTRETRLLFRRGIRDRIAKLLPFVELDSDPYLILADGKLYWMQDAYTTTDRYPYAASFGGGLNYIRNSVKIVVDAYTGDVRTYVADESDPIIRAYRSAMPDAFRPLSAMPPALLAHIRYPEDMFRVQSRALLQYHMLDPLVFYNKGDVWAIPAIEPQPDQPAAEMRPYYVIMKLPGAKQEEFILMFPFRRESKKNMVAWMCARCDPKDYGRLLLYEFPKGMLVYGPSQVAGRANQNAEISREITLWNSAGSSVTWGNLLVIPIESSLLYIRPLYLESTDTKIPEFRRVVAAMGDQLAWASSLQEALAQLAGAPVPRPREAPAAPVSAAGGAPAAETIRELATRAQGHFDSAQEALRSGDWAAYGRHLNALRDDLRRLKEAAR